MEKFFLILFFWLSDKSTEEQFVDIKDELLLCRWVLYSGYEALWWTIGTGDMFRGNSFPKSKDIYINLMQYNHIPLLDTSADKTNSFNNFLTFLLQKAKCDYLARHKSNKFCLYKQVTIDNHETYAWVKKCTVKEFVTAKMSRIYFPAGYAKCCFCNNDCNPGSQTCGRCPRNIIH